MIEILTVAVLLLLFRLLIKSKNKKNGITAIEYENNSRKHQSINIVGESRFVLGTERKKQAEIAEPLSDSSGKIDIEVPLDYVLEDTEFLEEQEELERLGLQTDYSSDISFDDMISVVNAVGNDQIKNIPGTGKLLYENENTDWVGQLASSSENNAKRIASLIDLHLGRFVQSEAITQFDDGLKEFDIGEFVG